MTALDGMVADNAALRPNPMDDTLHVRSGRSIYGVDAPDTDTRDGRRRAASPVLELIASAGRSMIDCHFRSLEQRSNSRAARRNSAVEEHEIGLAVADQQTITDSVNDRQQKPGASRRARRQPGALDARLPPDEFIALDVVDEGAALYT